MRKNIQGLIMVLLIITAVILTACPQPVGGTDEPDSAASPAANPKGGTFTAVQTVMLTSTTGGAEIRYTTNGSEPTAGSTLYTGPININTTTTLKAIAVKDGMNNSSIITEIYTINLYAETAAKPTASPAGGLYTTVQTVTLTTTTGGAVIRYTTNGSEPTAGSTLYTSSININQTTTLKAIAVKDGMNNSAVMTETYTINDEEPGETFNLSSLGLGGGNVSLTIPRAGNVVLNIDGYSDPAAFAPITGIPNITSALNGRDLTVNINGAADGSLSLAYVHCLRRALLTAMGATATPGSLIINSTLTPVFSGEQWWAEPFYYGNNLEEINLYRGYSDGDIIMNGIVISKNSDNKYMIRNNRDIKVIDLIWWRNIKGVETPFHNFGLEKGTGKILPITSWENVRIHGGVYEYESSNNNAIIDNFSTYNDALKLAGLHPSQKDAAGNPVLLDHSRVQADYDKEKNPAADFNVVTNGMYDFILAYYNPGSTTPDNRDLLFHTWPANLVFDGLTTPVPSRNVGGATLNNLARKAADGKPNNNFVNNIEIPVANFMKLPRTIADRGPGVSEFRNTNILGDGGMWNGTTTFDLPSLTNVGLMGDYGGANINNNSAGKIRGVLDIEGSAPTIIINDSQNGYLNLWNVKSNMAVNRFRVVSIKNLNDITKVNVINPWDSNAARANVIIYPGKYATTAIAGEVSAFQPQYRAFMSGNNGTGTPQVMPVDTAPDTAYRGTVSAVSGAPNVYPLAEKAWIDATNANNGAAPDPVSYASTSKVDVAAFNALPVASAAPARSNIRIVSAGGERFEAVMPATLGELLERRRRSASVPATTFS